MHFPDPKELISLNFQFEFIPSIHRTNVNGNIKHIVPCFLFLKSLKFVAKSFLDIARFYFCSKIFLYFRYCSIYYPSRQKFCQIVFSSNPSWNSANDSRRFRFQNCWATQREFFAALFRIRNSVTWSLEFFLSKKLNLLIQIRF